MNSGIYAVIKPYAEKDACICFHYKPNDHYGIYDKMMQLTDNDHEISCDAASWCELATIGETYEFREGEIEIMEIEQQNGGIFVNDLLSKGDKIYYIDFEDSKASYTVLEIRNAKPGSFVKGGPYYYVHSDNLSNATGYYPIFVEEVDKEDGRGYFFSSPEKAHEAYEKFKIKTEYPEFNVYT